LQRFFLYQTVIIADIIRQKLIWKSFHL